MLLEEYYNSGDLNEAAVSLQARWLRRLALCAALACAAVGVRQAGPRAVPRRRRAAARGQATSDWAARPAPPAPLCLPLTQELDHPEFGHYAVKRALATAFDKHDREREMTSVLLSTLYNEVRAPPAAGRRAAVCAVCE